MEKKIQQVEIGLASPEQIKQWAERRLPNGEIVGEVTSWETVNYKTLKPEPHGLFCQRIFGPVVDYTCACNKKSEKISTGFCPKCGVERTTSRVRRYRLGYIKFHQPIVHPLYALNRPSPVNICLNWPNKRFQAVLYGTEFCKLPVDFPIFLSDIAIYWFFLKNIKQSTKKKKNEKKNKISKKPKLFRSSNQNWSKITKLETEFLLYGITYDATWRQVENIQNFLLYSWEQAKTDDKPIPYYTYQKFLNKNRGKPLPLHDQYYPLQTGGLVVQNIFSIFDLVSLSKREKNNEFRLNKGIKYFQAQLNQSKGVLNFEEYCKKVKLLNSLKQKKTKCSKRLQYFRDFFDSGMNPAWMVLSYLPVLPPGLRPIMSIQGQLIVSDINSLYRKVLTRNKRVTSVTKFQIFDTALSGSWASWCYNLRQVQEAVNSLIKTGSVVSGKTTKSLLDSLKGKKGRFRQHLLGKRVDYSGRSVIVVGPKLKIYECGLPKQMALELFQPFIIQKLRNKRIALTNATAKAIISQKKPVLWSLLEEIMKNHPVLLNRAPTLHRLGIQAFLPRLIEGKAILLHPLVCPAFNADFDGDQMAVHIPLGAHARSEAFHLMWSRNHLLAPASGQPLLLPTQDMVLGCYYLTIFKNFKLKQYTLDRAKKENNSSFKYYFSTLSEVQQAYDQGLLETHFPIWFRWFGILQNFLSQEDSKLIDQPIEFRVDIFGKSEFIFHDRQLQKQKDSSDSFYVWKSIKNSMYLRTTPGRVFFHSKIPH